MRYNPFDRGEWPVGVRTIQFGKSSYSDAPTGAEVWYPAAHPYKGYDLNEVTCDRFTITFGAEFTQAAVRNAPYTATRVPLLVYCHGGYGDRRDNAALITHLVSHGYVVVAPRFIDSIADMGLEGQEATIKDVPIDRSAMARPLQASWAITEILAGADPETARIIDPSRIGAFGASLGGYTALELNVVDNRILGTVGLAPACGYRSPIPGMRRIQSYSHVDAWRRPVPTTLIAGDEDVLVKLEDVRDLCAKLPGWKRLAVLHEAGHLHMFDHAEFGHELYRREYTQRYVPRSRDRRGGDRQGHAPVRGDDARGELGRSGARDHARAHGCARQAARGRPRLSRQRSRGAVSPARHRTRTDDRGRRMNRALGALLAIAVWCGEARAQELDARAYSPAPIGTTIVLGGVGGSKGAVLFDPSADIAGVEADMAIVTAGLGYTFGLAGRQARLLAVAPMAWGRFEGVVAAQAQQQDVNGLVDPRIKLSVALRGAPAMTPAELARAPRGTVVGTSVTVMVPAGSYESTRALNLGYHRWAIKPEIGATRTTGAWTFDAYIGVWLFTANDRQFPGRSRKRQDPLGSVQGHVSYALPHRMWIALDTTWFAGGTTNVDGLDKLDEQRNTRVGATFSIPIARHQSLKLTYSSGTSTRRGTDFDNLMLTWHLVRRR